MTSALSKTPLVLAIASAFTLAAGCAQAADRVIGSDEVPASIGSDTTWDVEWANEILGEDEDTVKVTPGDDNKNNVVIGKDGSLSIKLSNKSGEEQKLVFSGAGLQVEGGALTIGSDVTIQDNGSLNFSGSGDFAITKNGKLTLSGGEHGFAIDNSADTSVSNAGTIVLKDKANFSITSAEEAANPEKQLDAMNFGDITVEGGSTLTNSNKGYTIDAGEAEGQAEGDAEAEKETLSRVTFGTVKVTGEGSRFVNAEGAIDSGKALELEQGGQADIKGTSNWSAVSIDAKAEGDKASSVVNVGAAGKLMVGSLSLSHVAPSTESSASLADFVKARDGGEWQITDALVVSSFSGKAGTFTLSKVADGAHLADGVDVVLGKGISSTDIEFKAQSEGADATLGFKTDADVLNNGTMTISGFNAEWKVDESSDGEVEGGEGSAKVDGEEPAKGEWQYKRFGSLEVRDNMKLVLENNATTASESAEGYHAAITADSLTLSGTTLKTAYTVLVEKITEKVKDVLEGKDGANDIDYSDWTADNLKDKIAELEEKYGTEDFSLVDVLNEAQKALEEKISGDLFNGATAGSAEIMKTDIAIGTLSFEMNEVERDIGEVFKTETPETKADGDEGTNEGGSEGDGEEKEDYELSFTNNFGAPELTISESTVEVGTLDMAQGVIDSSDSNFIVHAIDGTLGGEIYFKNGFLGLNTSTTAADLKKPADGSEGAAGTLADDNAPKSSVQLDVGSPVKLGANGKLVLGVSEEDAAGIDSLSKAENAVIYFGEDTDLTFDASRFGWNSVFSAELGADVEKDGGKGSVVVADGKTVYVKGKNLSWGIYKVFDGESFDISLGKDAELDASGSSASDTWKDRVENADGIKIDKNGQLIVGGVGIAGSGLEEVNAKNLVSAVFGGNRSGAVDLVLINALLSGGGSVDAIRTSIDSLTGLGAIASVNALTVDLLAYTSDMIEHHASTIPLDGEGWWVMPLGGRMEADDLKLGSTAYGYSLDTYGLMGGYDLRLASGTVLGLAASYQSGDADSEGDVLDTTTDVTNYGVHLWGAREYGDVKVTGTLSWMKTDGEASMSVLGGEATADVKATAWAASLRADLRKSFGSFELIPHAGVRAAMIDIDNYDILFNDVEAFGVNEDKIVVFEVPVGVTAATHYEIEKWTVRPYADITLRGRFGDTDSSYTLTGSSTKDTVGYDVTGDFVGDIKLGWMSTHKDLNLGMSYGFSAGDAGRQAHRIEATMRVLLD